MKTLVVAVALLTGVTPAMAQLKTPAQIQADINARLKTLDNLNQQIAAKTTAAAANVTGTPSDPTSALPCMDIKMLIRLTPENLLPTMKACVQDVNNQLVSDTQRALDSAKVYQGPTGGAMGDNDGVNCLTPALSLFQAAAIVPAVPSVPAVAAAPAVPAAPAVLNPDGSVKTPAVIGTPAVVAAPAVVGTPELDPGPVLLFQKYREFTLAGALTSCQSWFNGPINATMAAGVAGAATVAGGAALLVPKP